MVEEMFTKLVWYWPVVVWFVLVAVANWLVWLVTSVVQNYRWRRVVLDGKYVTDKVRERLQQQKLVIQWHERELKKLREERDDAVHRLDSIRAILEVRR